MSESEQKQNEESGDSLRHRGHDSSGGGGGVEKSKSQINAEYFQALEQWLNDAWAYRYSCSFFATLPFALMAQQMNGLPPQSQTAAAANNFARPFPTFNQNMFNFPNMQQRPQPQRQQQTQPPEDGVEYTIPPFWKRFMAEMLDFIVCFLIKMTMTFVAIEFFDFVDVEKFDTLHQQSKMDYKVTAELISKILFIEILYRVIICLYEGIFLRKGIQNQIGGATPGKTFMQIRVVLCSNVQPVENRPNVVKVYPATDLGLKWSFARALLKNLVLAFLFPLCFPFFFNKFNRTAYDILCHSIVVEDRPPGNRVR